MLTAPLPPDEAAMLEAAIEIGDREIAKRFGQSFWNLFPDEGPLRRELYPQHLLFFAAGAEFSERLFMAANRVGKTLAGAFEVCCHATGRYPDWWTGKRFYTPVEVWACGTTGETTRDVVQGKLLGPWNRPGEGLGVIPQQWVIQTTPKPHGLRGSIESVQVRHHSGGVSIINFKTYEQGRKSFEGTSKHVIWDDEEPPMDVYQEQLLRTLDVKGITIVTFTPLQGMSEVVTGYLEASEEAREVKMYVQAGWDDVPHLDEGFKKRLIATMLPYQIAARTKGEPSLGAGAIYPIMESDIVIPTRSYPHTWPKGFGLDVGWNRTAAVFVTQDVSTGIYIIYDMHYLSMGEPPTHAMGIRARGEWLQGVIDPAGRGRSQIDGKRLVDQYQSCGVNLSLADNAVEAGLQAVWTLLVSGMLKVDARCEPWLREWRKYHRDEKGNIVKHDDHAMDATRYWAMSGRDKMTIQPARERQVKELPGAGGGRTWMAG